MINNYSVYEDGSVSFIAAQSIPPSLCPVDGPAVIDFELNRLLARDERAATPGASYKPLRACHWQEMPELPRYASAIESPTLDLLIANDERVQRSNTVGYFCGQPIVTVDELGMEVDEERDLRRRLDTSSGTSIAAEILPGEVLCADNIIRRITTAEATGYDVYHNQVATEAEQRRVSIEEARTASVRGELVYYRPNRATLEVHRVGTELPLLAAEPEPFALVKEALL